MFELSKQERFIVLVLISSLALGLGYSAHKRTRASAVTVRVKGFQAEALDEKAPRIGIGRININTAGTEDLMRLKGVGKSLARRIIERRETKGRFSSASEIKEVKGIGDRLFEQIQDDITAE